MRKDVVYLRSKDVAHILDCSPDDLYELVRKGELRGDKHGRFWRYLYDDVVAYKEKKEAEEAE